MADMSRYAVIAAAVRAVDGAMDDGDAHGYTDEWTRQPASEHLTHAMQHLLDHMRGDTGDNHLAHALCRVAMALSRRNDEAR